jgi:hypothetical protein
MKKITLPPTVDEQVVNSSRRARAWLSLITAATLVRALSSVLALLTVCAILALPVSAQSVLGNDATRAVSLVKRGIDILSWGMMIAGILGIAKAINIGRQGQKGWESPGGWGIAGFGFGYVLSWLNAEVQGNQVALPEP